MRYNNSHLVFVKEKIINVRAIELKTRIQNFTTTKKYQNINRIKTIKRDNNMLMANGLRFLCFSLTRVVFDDLSVARRRWSPYYRGL